MRRVSLFTVLLMMLIVLSACGTKVNKNANDADSDNGQQEMTEDQSSDEAVTTTPTGQQSAETQTTMPGTDDTTDEFTQGKTSYVVNRESFSEGEDIIIYYPQISGLDDQERQDKINEIIRQDARSVLPEDNDLSKLNLELDYEIKWQGSNVLSIWYDGMEYYEEAAHPNNIIITTNIDMNRGSRIKFQDIFYIDQLLVENLLRKNTYVWPLGSAEQEIMEYIQQELIDDFIKSTLYDNSFYLAWDFVGFSKFTSHAAGDYAVYEVKYQDILDSINAGHEAWNDFPNVTASLNARKGDPEETITEHRFNVSDLIDFKVDEAQSFETDFENWGSVRFLSGTDFRGKRVFFLVKEDNTVLYEFPDYLGGFWKDQTIDAIAFRDVNDDGLKDVIIITSDEYGNSYCDIYFQRDKEFVRIQEIYEALNQGGDKQYTTVKMITDYMNKTGKAIANRKLIEDGNQE